ncbi:hypothetical protein GQ600_18296 [Phytophthora cactorum]|nr:hypothetical protein GQ600_18296 [Phytophthora cactorum]
MVCVTGSLATTEQSASASTCQDHCRRQSKRTKYRSGEAKTCVTKLYAVVNNLALEPEKDIRAVKRMTSKSAKPGKGFSTKGSAKVFGKKPAIAVVVIIGGKRSASTQPKESAQRKITRPPHPKQCFHYEGEHEFDNYPTTTEADKAAIREKEKRNISLEDNLGTSKGNAARLCRIREWLPEGGTVLLEGVLNVLLCTNSGATVSCMSERVFKELKKIECVELTTPIPCVTVGGGVDVKQAANVQVTLRTAAGPVYIGSPVQCWLYPEFNLGKDIIALLGIDVDRELEMIDSQGSKRT